MRIASDKAYHSHTDEPPCVIAVSSVKNAVGRDLCPKRALVNAGKQLIKALEIGISFKMRKYYFNIEIVGHFEYIVYHFILNVAKWQLEQ